MYKQRLYIFISLCILAVFVCVLRLAYLQVFRRDHCRERIKDMRILAPVQLPTLRGSIIDRNGNIIAEDRPEFCLKVSYTLTRLLDDRFWEWNISRRTKGQITRQQAELELYEEYGDARTTLEKLIDRCAQMESTPREDIEARIRNINEKIWNKRAFFAWSEKCLDSKLREQYKGRYVPLSKALEEFERTFPNFEQRLNVVMKIKVPQMRQSFKIMELTTDTQLFEAQLEFAELEHVEIVPEVKRYYPYGSAACQIVGWVGAAHEGEQSLFDDDDNSRYLENETCGKRGVERVCEVVLRGRRGEVVYSKDKELIDQTDTIFGKDVRLSLDIELQKRIETVLTDPEFNKNSGSAMGAVVIDVETGDILSMVSLPGYDLNTIRTDFEKIADCNDSPLENKALYTLYPPGSTIKPFILAAGLEQKKVSYNEVISCPYESAGKRWPNCMQYRRFHGCHDWKWQDDGGNIARNAIKGSCNVYFSRLADRLVPSGLQATLLEFGFGRAVLSPPDFEQSLAGLDRNKGTDRNLRQSQGQIGKKNVGRSVKVRTIDDVPTLTKSELRWFGIGQGNLRVTVLQVANAMAAVARGGVFKNPRLFVDDTDRREQAKINVSADSFAVVRDGMGAVANETGGTAYSAFIESDLRERGVKIYGKTGSTERPYNAWFAGFVKDDRANALSIAVIVEGGKTGSGDAAPLGCEILRLCANAGYIGRQIADE